MAAALLSADIANAKQRRLHELQRRAATLGYETPPQITLEIQDIQREIAAAAPATVAESHDILFTLIQDVRTDVRRLYWLLPLLLLLVIIAVKL